MQLLPNQEDTYSDGVVFFFNFKIKYLLLPSLILQIIENEN